MHELSIAISILETVQQEVDAGHYPGVDAIHVRVGALSGVVARALAPAYELAAEQTSFARSRLVIEESPVIIYCAACRRNETPEPPRYFCCPACGRPSSEIVSGRELEITALELIT